MLSFLHCLAPFLFVGRDGLLNLSLSLLSSQARDKCRFD